MQKFVHAKIGTNKLLKLTIGGGEIKIMLSVINNVVGMRVKVVHTERWVVPIHRCHTR